MSVSPAVGDPLRYWIDLTTHNEEFYSDDATGVLTKRVGVLSLDPTDNPEGEVKAYWGGYKNRQPGITRAWVAEVVPFTVYDTSDWDEGDYRMVMKVLNSRYISILDAFTHRIDAFYKALTGFDAGELADYGFVDLFGADEKLPLVWTGYSSALNSAQGVRTISLTFEERSVIL